MFISWFLPHRSCHAKNNGVVTGTGIFRWKVQRFNKSIKLQLYQRDGLRYNRKKRRCAGISLLVIKQELKISEDAHLGVLSENNRTVMKVY